MIFHREGRIVNSSCGPDIWKTQLVSICGFAGGGVTDMNITYLLAHVIDSNCFNFDRLFKVDVMNLPACPLMISGSDI